MKKQVAVEDYSKSNPGLHMLYVETALVHLRAIDEMQRKASSFSNSNMLDLQIALERERKKLVSQNMAYKKADEMLRSLGLTVNTAIVPDEG